MLSQLGGSNLDDEANNDPDSEYDFAFYADLMRHVTTAYDCMKPIIYCHYNKMLLKKAKDAVKAENDDVEKHNEVVAVNALQMAPTEDDKGDILFVHFLKWIQVDVCFLL